MNWSLFFLGSYSLMMAGGFGLDVSSEATLLSMMTIEEGQLPEGYSSTGQPIVLGLDEGLVFMEPSQYLMTPSFSFQQSITLRFTWLAFSMGEEYTPLAHVFSIQVEEEETTIPSSSMRLDHILEVSFSLQGNFAIIITYDSPWVDQGSYLMPTLKQLEVFDGDIR